MVVVKFLFRIANLSWALLLSAGAVADDLTKLNGYLSQMDGVVSSFVQTISDPSGTVVERSVGQLHLQKPQVRWEVSEPFPQVILLGHERDLRIYDPDLEQVTERLLGEDWAQVPLALLTQSDLDLSGRFDVRLVSTGLFELTPTAPQALFQKVLLSFDGAALKGIRITDQGGQITLIEFEHFLANQVIPAEKFELTLPPGTEIVRG